MKCPYCDKEINDISNHRHDRYNQPYWCDDYVMVIRVFHCPHCNKNLVLNEGYRLESRRFYNKKEYE